MKKYATILLILLTIQNCSKENDKSIFESLFISFVRKDRVTLTGSAVKGLIKNADIKIHPLLSDGTCNTKTVLGSAISDQAGDYSVFFNRGSGVVCIQAKPNSDGNTKMFDEKLNQDISVLPNSDFTLTSIISEDKISGNSKGNNLLSPFSKFAARRFANLMSKSENSANLSALNRKASKEVVIRFGLNAGLSAVNSRNETLTRSLKPTSVSEVNYPEMDDIDIQIGNLNNPLSVKYITVLAGFSYLANQFKRGTVSTTDDVNSVIDSFAKDFEDGVFDGKDSTGKAVTIGTGSNQRELPADSITNLLLPAMNSFIQEGGRIGVGQSSISLPLSSLSQVQFLDSVSIVSVNLGIDTGTTMVTVATPTFLPTPGHFSTAQPNITLTTATAGATIYYTTNGTTPTTASTVYTTGLGHIWFLAGKTLKAIAVKSGSIDSAVATAEYSYSPLKSGQTLCYNATVSTGCPGLGDDGSTQLGVARSYTDNGNSTVTDNTTGLLWQKCSLGQTAGTCGAPAASMIVWATAQTDCAALTTAGKTWRLPTRYEFETLPDYATSNPSINGNFPTTFAGAYWSFTTYAPTPANAWQMVFTDGSSPHIVKSAAHRVRCVSGDIQTSFVKYIDNGDGTIKDKQTGLTWQKCSIGQANDSTCSGTASNPIWVTALSSCSSLSLAGKTWRLPSIKELKSIVDTNIAAGASIDAAFFPSTGSNLYWSSTTYEPTPVNVWGVYFNDGAVDKVAKTDVSRFTRCVSGP